MKAFVTGGAGFIGQHVVRKLIARGHEVFALSRSPESTAVLKAFGAHTVSGDILEAESVRTGMQGCDAVFHLAGWYELGSQDWSKAEKINVDGTRNVLSLAYELGVSKIVYASTVAVFGDTRGQVVDESYRMPEGQTFLTEYDRTKWKAHYEVALPLIEKGAPIIIVQPGAVYGPGDHSLVGDLMRYYYRGLFPIFPAPQLTLSFVHVEDAAEGIFLAAEKGKPGESYILTDRVLPLNELVKIWARVTGKSEPLASIPSKFIKPLAPLSELMGSLLPGWPPLFSRDALAILDASYAAHSDKAQKQLGWKARDIEIGMRETFDPIRQVVRPLAPGPGQRRQIAGIALGAALGLLTVWLLTRRRD